MAVGKTKNIPGMYNRQTSNGPYAIWGHAMKDLVIEGVTLNEETGIWELLIES